MILKRGRMKSLFKELFLISMISVFLSSCYSSKKVTYFRDISDTTHGSKVPMAVFSEPKIQPDDILSVSILTIDPMTSLITNQVASATPSVGTSSASAIGSQVVTGFLVDKDGYIELSMIGKLKVGGLTTFEARDSIRQKAAAFFKDATINVRFANFKVTILGEVAKPATYTLPNEKVTLLDAIGLAGDLTIYGKRKNVLLIRDNNGKKEFERFDLNSSEIFESPYFYLKQNDVVYVEPTKAKVATLNVARTQNIALAGTVLSVLIVLISRVQFK